MRLIKGSQLNPRQVAEVRSAFIYRWLSIGEGKYYPNEEAWLNDHAFYIRKDGGLADRRHAQPAFMAEVQL